MDGCQWIFRLIKGVNVEKIDILKMCLKCSYTIAKSSRIDIPAWHDLNAWVEIKGTRAYTREESVPVSDLLYVSISPALTRWKYVFWYFRSWYYHRTSGNKHRVIAAGSGSVVHECSVTLVVTIIFTLLWWVLRSFTLATELPLVLYCTKASPASGLLLFSTSNSCAKQTSIAFSRMGS